jgi:hypothetical protein
MIVSVERLTTAYAKRSSFACAIDAPKSISAIALAEIASFSRSLRATASTPSNATSTPDSGRSSRLKKPFDMRPSRILASTDLRA